jgi:isopenicillin N synthase-like dioxygenase
LLFQREGEDGLEICPGRESHSSFAMGDDFTPLPAHTGPIVVNIGDMLSESLLDAYSDRLTRLQWLGRTTGLSQISIV